MGFGVWWVEEQPVLRDVMRHRYQRGANVTASMAALRRAIGDTATRVHRQMLCRATLVGSRGVPETTAPSMQSVVHQALSSRLHVATSPHLTSNGGPREPLSYYARKQRCCKHTCEFSLFSSVQNSSSSVSVQFQFSLSSVSVSFSSVHFVEFLQFLFSFFSFRLQVQYELPPSYNLSLLCISLINTRLDKQFTEYHPAAVRMERGACPTDSTPNVGQAP